MIKDTHIVHKEHDAATGAVTREAWYKDDKLDRVGGPALIYRDAATGAVTLEVWFRDGKCDRADGPALINRDAATGAVTCAVWCKDGARIDPPVRPSAVTSAVVLQFVR